MAISLNKYVCIIANILQNTWVHLLKIKGEFNLKKKKNFFFRNRVKLNSERLNFICKKVNFNCKTYIKISLFLIILENVNVYVFSYRTMQCHIISTFATVFLLVKTTLTDNLADGNNKYVC